MMQPSYSPDQTVRVDWTVEQGRMSHEILTPRVVWLATGECILDMGWDWDGGLQWDGSGNAFFMHYRRYAQGGSVTVWVDPAHGVFRIGGAQGAEEPLATIHTRLQEEIAPSMGGHGHPSPATPALPPWKAVLMVLGWVVGIFGVIGFAVWKWNLPSPRSGHAPTPVPLHTIPTPRPFTPIKQPTPPPIPR